MFLLYYVNVDDDVISFSLYLLYDYNTYGCYYPLYINRYDSVRLEGR